ncbi:MAG: metal-dependent hydrolase [Vicinamibacterales bacterium]
MDNVTHTLFGATLGRAVFHRAGRGTTAVLILASNAPDADIVMAAGGTLDYLAWHRGPTHGPLGVVGLAAVSAALVWGWLRYGDRERRGDHAPFATLFLAALVGLVAHVLMDFPTAYGTRLLSPFSWRWFSTDLMPIVDIYLLIVLAGALILGRRRADMRRQLAMVALAYTLLNYSFRAGAHQWALRAAPQVLAPVLPARCPAAVPPSLFSQWPIDGTPARGADDAGRCVVEIAALPTFFSPFRWQLIARTTDSYQTLPLNLLRDPARPVDSPDAPWRNAVYYPNQWTSVARRAAHTTLGRVFLGFSRFPATQSELHADHSATVRWTDLRFADIAARRPGPRTNMFSAVVTLAADGHVLEAQLGE